MSIAHDTATASHASASSSASQASFNWSHTGGASARALLVLVFSSGTGGNTNPVTSVTYGAGATNVPAVSGGEAACNVASGEPGNVKAFFLDNCGTGTNTVTVNRTNNTTQMWAVAITVTKAAGATAVTTTGVVLLQGNATAAISEQNVDDGSPGSSSVRYAGSYYGGNSPAPAGANSTSLFSNDLGSYGHNAVRETTAGQGSRPVGFAQATGDDRAVVHLALREILPAAISGQVDGVGASPSTLSTPGLTQWVETASKATAAAQTGPSWSITPDGANAVGLVWTGAITAVASTPAAISGTAAGSGEARTWGLNLIDNPSFEANTTGWATTGFSLTSGASLARTSGGTDGDSVGQVTTTAIGQGVHYSPVNQLATFTAGVRYHARVQVAGIFGSMDVAVVLGDAAGDHATTAVTVGTSMQDVVVMWIPTADRDATNFGLAVVAQSNPTFAGFFIDAAVLAIEDGTGLTATARPSGLLAGSGAASGTLKTTSLFSGTLAGVGAISLHDLASPAPLSGTLAGAGAATGSLGSGVPAISGTLAGAGAVTGTVTTSAPLSGTVAGAGAASGALTVIKAMTGAPAGVGAVTGALRAMTQITGTVDGSGSASGTVVTTPPGITQWAITANRAAGTQLGPAWAITPDGPDAQSLVWVGAIAGAAAYLTGTTAGVGAAPAVLSARTFLSGTANGAGSAIGSPAGRAVLAGTAAGVGAAPSTLTTTARLSATSAGTGAATATVTTGSGPVISGTVAGLGFLAGGPRAFTLLSGSAAGVGSLTGQPWVVPGLTQWALTASKATISLQTGPSWSASPDGPNAVALVWAGAVRPFTLLPALSGIAIGSSSATGGPTTPGVAPMAGTTAGVGSIAGALTAPRAAWLTAFTRHAPGMLGIAMAFDQAIVAGVGTVTGGLASGAPTLAGSVAGVGGATGALASLPVLAGSAAGAGTLTGALVLPRLLSGTLAGVGSASGVLAGQVAGSAAGVGSASGSLIVAASITAFAAGVGSASPSQVTTPGQAILGGAPAGVGALTGALKVSGALAGSVAGSSAVAGSLTAPAVLTGTVDGVGSAAGNVTSTFGVTGTASGTGAATGAMTVAVQFGGSVNGTGDIAGSFTATAAMTETLIGPGSVTGNLTTPGVAALVATADGSGSVSGSLTVPALGAVSGTSAGVGTVVAVLGSQIALSGNLLGSGAASGTVSVPVVLAGTSTGVGLVVAHLRTTRHHRSNPAGVITRSTVGVGTITP